MFSSVHGSHFKHFEKGPNQQWDINQSDQVYGVTEHGVGDGEGERGSARHPPAGAQVGQFDSQHLHDHLVVQG